MQKKIPNEQNVQITVQILSVPLVQLFFFLCCASLLKPDSKAKLYQESDFQRNVEAFKNWQNVTATLLSQQTPHAKDLVYSTPTAVSRI